MEDLPLGLIAGLVPEFAEKDLPLGRTLVMMMMMMILYRTAKILLLTCFYDKLPLMYYRVLHVMCYG